MKALAMIVACLLSSVCLAQRDDYFPDVPSNHWVFEALVNLHKAGVISTPLSLVFRGGRPPTRMEVADWTVHASSAMLSRLEAAEQAHQVGDDGIGGARAQAAFLDKHSEETDSLARMAFLFEPELKRRFVDAKALRQELLTFPKRLKDIFEPQGNSPLPRGIAGSDDPLFITSTGVVQEFNPAKQSFVVLHTVPMSRYTWISAIVSKNDRYGLVLRDKQFGDWRVEVRDRDSGRLLGSVEGDRQAALVARDDGFVIETDGRAVPPRGLDSVSVTSLAKRPEIPLEVRNGVDLLNLQFEVPLSLHSRTGYSPERLCPGWGTSQGRILTGGRYAVIARNRTKDSQKSAEPTYSLVDMNTGYIYADYGKQFKWSDVFIIDRFVVLAASDQYPGSVHVYNLSGKLVAAMEYAKCG
jgi:hypothetical protein